MDGGVGQRVLGRIVNGLVVLFVGAFDLKTVFLFAFYGGDFEGGMLKRRGGRRRLGRGAIFAQGLSRKDQRSDCRRRGYGGFRLRLGNRGGFSARCRRFGVFRFRDATPAIAAAAGTAA